MRKEKTTNLGKYLRKIRVDRGETGFDMANRLEVTPQYVSLIETGKRRLNNKIKEKIIKVYSLNDNQIEELERVIIMDAKKININIEGLEIEDVNFILLLTNKMKNMKECDKTVLKNIINNIGENE